MRIRSYEAVSVDLPLREGYRIAGQRITFVRNVLLRLETESGLRGYGSAAPAGDVCGESDDACLQALRGPLRKLALGAEVGPDPSPLSEEALHSAPACPAARAALDMALWDLAAREVGVPLVRLWGGELRPLPTSVTIGICSVQDTLEAGRRWIEQGFQILKVKIGEEVELDIERLRRLRAVLGPEVTLRVDGNQGYTIEAARALLRGAADLNLEMFEQPLDARDLDGLAELRRESQVPIVADESARSADEAGAIIDRHAAHGINIKLMKCGGPSQARVIHDRAHAAGLSLMLGCNDETRVSIAAAAHLSVALPGVVYADLDGHMDLSHDPASGGFEIRDGSLHLDDRPGLGVNVEL